MPWILCGPGAPPESTGESSGSTATILSVRLARLQHLADAGDRAAGADAGDEDVDLAVRVVPDLLGGGAAVDVRIGGVLNCCGMTAPGIDRDHFLGLGDGALHALRGRA